MSQQRACPLFSVKCALSIAVTEYQHVLLSTIVFSATGVSCLLQNLGKKETTLYDIRDELFGLYKERRKAYRSLTMEERFHLLTGETADTLQVGKLIMCTVSGIVRKKPMAEVLENENAIMRSEQTNLYQCPFCMIDIFQDLSAVCRFHMMGLPACDTVVSIGMESS